MTCPVVPLTHPGVHSHFGFDLFAFILPSLQENNNRAASNELPPFLMCDFSPMMSEGSGSLLTYLSYIISEVNPFVGRSDVWSGLLAPLRSSLSGHKELKMMPTNNYACLLKVN